MRILKYLFLILVSTAAALAQVPGNATAGIGIAVGLKGQSFVVINILPDSPAAAQKDIHSGDRILAVAQGDEPAVQVQGAKMAEVVGLVRGPKGTTVRLTLVPAGKDDSEAQVVSFVRGELKVLQAQEPGTEGVRPVPRRPPPASHHWLIIGEAVLILAGAGLFFLLRWQAK